MDFGPVVANWVLDFYLRQPIEDRTLKSLLRAVPLPSGNPNLQKLLLLKKLEFEASSHLISEGALELMERLEEVESRRGNKAVSDAMRRAYCAVAVESTLRRVKIGNGSANGRKNDFFEMVKRVWRGRIGKMEKVSGEEGLGSELLWMWKDMIETAVWDDSACESVLKKFEGVSAGEAVKVYVREERAKMGPSFLELMAETVKNEEGLQTVIGSDGIGRVSVEKAPSCHLDMATSGSNPNKEMHKRKTKLRDVLVGVRHPRGKSSSSSGGAKAASSDETAGVPPPCKNCGSPRSAQVKNAREADNYGSPRSAQVKNAREAKNYGSPRSAQVKNEREAPELGSLEFQAAVKDSLPDATRVAEEISREAIQNKQDNPAEGNDGRPELLIVDAAGVVQSSGGYINKAPVLSLMVRNSTARTYEWDDSINESQEDIACKALLRIPSPKRLITSPLKICELSKMKKRRIGRRWTLLEEDTLRAGVEVHGKGNWKVILTAHRDIFEGRTEVDLKDKWRNLTRYS